MVRLTLRKSLLSSLILCLCIFSAAPVTAQCNTDQNPYCAGNSQFEQLCCTYPNICYWSNRNGDPACCQAGTDCSGDGGPIVFNSVSSQQTTALIATSYQTSLSSSTFTQYSTITYYCTTPTYSPPPTEIVSLSTIATPAVVVVTDSNAILVTQGPPSATGAFVTVTQVQVVGGAPRLEQDRTALVKIWGHAAIIAFLPWLM